MNRLKLTVPSIEQLSYRKKILADPATMDYNRGFEVDVEGYDKETGCINFEKSKWEDWYENWINNDKERFYAYLLEKDSECPFGEVSLRFDERREIHIINIVIEGKYRGKGYGKEGLKLLLDKAFFDFGLEKVGDEFPENRTNAYKLFKKFGFRVAENNNNIIFVVLDKQQYLKNQNI